MSWIKKSAAVVAINIGVLLGLLALIALVPPLLADLGSGLHHAYKKILPATASRKSVLPAYEKYDWSGKHFAEFSALQTTYYDYIGWRRAPFSGETITIDGQGYRQHGKTEGLQAATWFFGGSTMWGTGVIDSMTIPAFFAADSGLSSFNFGETAYTAHQSLNLLMKAYLSGGKPQHVVFYDGVNDVAHKCRYELNYYSSAREQQIREKLKPAGFAGSSFMSVLSPSIEILSKPFRKHVDKSKLFDCDTNAEKARLVAAALVQDWELAQTLVEAHGGEFTPVLQPVAHIGSPNLKHLPEVAADQALRRQYQAVYAEVKRQLKTKNLRYLDGSALFDGSEPLYIDFCHVGPEGNKKVANEIRRFLAR